MKVTNLNTNFIKTTENLAAVYTHTCSFKRLKKEKGITLIALIVTIIVLIILAGISINLISGSEGILARTTSSSEANEIATAKERVEMKIVEYTSEYYDKKYVTRTISNNTKAGDYIFEKCNGTEVEAGDYKFIIIKPKNEEAGEELVVDEEHPYDVLIKHGRRLKEDVTGTLSIDGILSWDDENRNLVNPDVDSGITTYTISFDTQGGKEISNITEKENTVVTELPIPEKQGYIFDGWYKEQERVTQVTLTTNIELIAHWKLKLQIGQVMQNNTTMYDNFGNQIVVPVGFKIITEGTSYTAESINVTKGIVIEDATENNTKGSQFVWVPVGNIYTTTDQVKDLENTTTIKLSRYEFDSNGNATEKSGNDYIASSRYSSIYHTETTSDSATALLSEFLTSAEKNHGYYIGRYEVGKEGTAVVCKKGMNVFNYVTRGSALNQSQNMYVSEDFKSDLTNSYAWDTAIIFIQKFTGLNYAMQYMHNTENTISLTGELEDEQCNINDMAGNLYEWTTEKCSSEGFPCTIRGGSYSNGDSYTAWRSDTWAAASVDYFTFRPILFIKNNNI